MLLADEPPDVYEPILIEGVAVGRESGDLTMICEWLPSMARIYAMRGDFGPARRMTDESLYLARQIEVPSLIFHAVLMRGEIEREARDPSVAATWYLRYFEGTLRDTNYLSRANATVACALRRYAEVCIVLGDPRLAAIIYGATSRPSAGWGTMSEGFDFASWSGPDESIAVARTALGDEAFARHWAEGQEMTIEQTVEHVLYVAREADAGAHPPTPGAASPGSDTSARLKKGAVFGTSVLGRRECEVAALVAKGLSNRAIADALVIAPRTVETHVSNILGKLGLHSRAQIAAWSVEHGLAAPHRN